MRVLHQSAWPFFLGGLILILAGCATKVGDSITIPMGELALHDAIPKERSIAKLESHIKEAQNDNMPFLAPHYYHEASDILKEIQQSSPNDVTTEDLAKADALLDKGETISALVKKTFAKELELKALLDQSTAKESYPWRYKTVNREFSRLIEKVELNGVGNIERDREELNQSMQALYTKAVQHAASQESLPGNKSENTKAGAK